MRPARSRRDDDLLFDDVTLDAADEFRAVGLQRLHLRAARGRLQRGLVVEPQLGDAVDLDLRLGNVGPRALGPDVVLHIAAHTGPGERQRAVNVYPAPYALRQRKPV